MQRSASVRVVLRSVLLLACAPLAAGAVPQGEFCSLEQGELTPICQGLFGHSVSISGDWAAVGAPGCSFWGGVLLYSRTGTTWTHQQSIIPQGTPNDLQYFGTSVSIDGDRLLVGDHDDSELALGAGAAFVFVRNGSTWVQEAKLLPSGGGIGSGFGISVSLSGDFALIGTDDDAAAYVFQRSGSSWSEVAILQPSSGNPYTFGRLVALNGDDALIGRPLTRTSRPGW